MVIWAFLVFFAVFANIASALPFSDIEIASMQSGMSGMPVGQRIALWAERFVGVPYDTDPRGLYVTTRRIVADESVDCMYHVFRSVELAITNSPADAMEAALDLRFLTRGVIGPDGLVENYEDRYQYAMDMIGGGKWGRDVTSALGAAVRIRGDRGLGYVDILPAGVIANALGNMRSGDVVYFIKDPERRVVGEVVGHLGVLKVEGGEVYLIHASGRKSRGGRVVRLPLIDYARDMPFVGIKLTRF